MRGPHLVATKRQTSALQLPNWGNWWLRHRTFGLIGSLALLLLTFALSLSLGTFDIEIGEVFQAIWQYDPTAPGQNVVRGLRLSRSVVGVVAGACLGISGALIQGVARNPLGAPGVLGLNSGAAFAMAIALTVLNVTAPLALVCFGFAGVAVTSVLVYAISGTDIPRATPLRLTLAGAVVGAFASSWTTAVVRLDSEAPLQLSFWLAGSLSSQRLEAITQLWPVIGAAMLVALLLGRELNALDLGDDLAATLGQRRLTIRCLTAFCVIILTGCAVALAGPIFYVGLAAPFLARLVAGGDFRWLIACSALVGGALLIAADTIGRLLIPNSELPAGVVCAAFGAPLFIYLVRTRSVAEL